MMRLLLSLLLFAAVPFELSLAAGYQEPGEEYTIFQPGDYTFNGKVVCHIQFTPIRDDAVARLYEYDPISGNDFVQEARIGKDGMFTLKTIKNMEDPPTPEWELYLQLEHPCFASPFTVYSGTLKADTENNGYFVTYRILPLEDHPGLYGVAAEP